MQQLIEKFKEHVILLSKNPKFPHSSWYIKYHLEIVEKIASELCETYKEADKDLVLLLVWLHDYGKIIDHKKQYELTLSEGKSALEEFGFPQEVVNKAIDYIKVMDEKKDLGAADIPIEIKIISSADGASHLVGPFFSLWWYENSSKPYEELMQNNINKAYKDWNLKIVLPEVKNAFKKRYDYLMEECGIFPERFLSDKN